MTTEIMLAFLAGGGLGAVGVWCCRRWYQRLIRQERRQQQSRQRCLFYGHRLGHSLVRQPFGADGNRH